MTPSTEQRLLTTRARIAVAIGLTAFVLLLTVRNIVRQTEIARYPLLGFGPRGWPLIAVNVAFYAYLCWMAFGFIRGSAGRERVFVVGWFVNILLWPAGMIGPAWAIAAHCIRSIALGLALLPAVSLLISAQDGKAHTR